MASLKEQETQLFASWKEANKGEFFVEDGIVNEEGYLRAPKKVLFLLKEVNSKEGGWSLSEFVGKGARKQSWNNIYRWLFAIQFPEKDWLWQSFQDISDRQRIDAFQEIAVMNLKKVPGSYTTINKNLYEYVRSNRDNIKKQFDLYSPDYVICCGSDVAANLSYVLGDIKWQVAKNGIKFARINKTTIIHFCHPEARIADNFAFFILLETIREIERLKLPEQAVWKRREDMLPEPMKSVLLAYKAKIVLNEPGFNVLYDIGYYDAEEGQFYNSQGIGLYGDDIEMLYWSVIPSI